MYIELKGEAHDKWGSSAGKYTRASGLSSGMPYWTNSDGTNALWLKEGMWRIGYKSNLGTSTQALYSTNSPPCPESIASNWKYGDDGEWLDAQETAKMHKYEGMTYYS